MKIILALILVSFASLVQSQQITPYLRYQTAQAWKYDDARRKTFDNIKDEKSLNALKSDIRTKVLNMIGGLPQEKTALNAKVTGKIQMDGFHIEKLIFESLPGFHVTALVYVPENNSQKHPSVLVACGHSPNGKIHYQALCQRLVQRGYLVICWDPVGQGERSQFWDESKKQSRYNLVCGEHAVLGNFAYLAGANLMRWEIWDGMRAVDYLFTRSDVDTKRISITGTSGGGAQASHIGALDERIKVVAPSCYITSLPMRAYNRSFADPDSDPEQDLFGTVSSGVDHPGLLLLVYPRPLFIASAVLDFFPIEGARKTFREVSDIYHRFNNGEKIDMVEGYHKHQFSDENQEAAFNFMDTFNEIPKHEGLAPVRTLTEKELLVATQGQVTLEFRGEKNLMDLVQEYYKDHQSEKRTIKYETGHVKFTSEKKSDSEYAINHGEYLKMSLQYYTGKSKKTTILLDTTGLSARLKNGESVITFNFRGDDKDNNPLASVQANYVYNSLLLGRPYFLEMIEDVEIVTTFARNELGIKEITIEGSEDNTLLLQQLDKIFPNVVKKPGLSWSQIIREKRELWPIQYLVPGGAYIE